MNISWSFLHLFRSPFFNFQDRIAIILEVVQIRLPCSIAFKIIDIEATSSKGASSHCNKFIMRCYNLQFCIKRSHNLSTALHSIHFSHVNFDLCSFNCSVNYASVNDKKNSHKYPRRVWMINNLNNLWTIALSVVDMRSTCNCIKLKWNSLICSL